VVDELRNAMVRAPVLALPNATDRFILDTDASDKSVGAELIQRPELVLSPLHSSTHQTPFLVHLPIDMSVSLLGPEGETPFEYILQWGLN
jgi:hypothetical protein